jgi:hypothetical protein
VSDGAKVVAAEIRRRHGAAVAGCLFYGSCLREGRDEGKLIDFYVLAEDYRRFHGRYLPAMLNALLPPNVYYLETETGSLVVRAKYAVISLEDLVKDTSASAFLSTLWGRLSQPCALVYERDAEVRATVAAALGAAVATMTMETLPLLPRDFTARDLWTRAFAESYRTELRSERSHRPVDLYQSYAERYERMTAAVLAELRADPGPEAGDSPRFRHRADRRQCGAAERRWWRRRVVGRVVQVLRLCKAAYTFTDGLDYILWKIEQHSGVRIEPTAWQRRHPLLAAPGLAWRLYRRQAIR